MTRVIQYAVVRGEHLGAFHVSMVDALLGGWQPWGSLGLDGAMFIQAVVKYADEAPT